MTRSRFVVVMLFVVAAAIIAHFCGAIAVVVAPLSLYMYLFYDCS